MTLKYRFVEEHPSFGDSCGLRLISARDSWLLLNSCTSLSVIFPPPQKNIYIYINFEWGKGGIFISRTCRCDCSFGHKQQGFPKPRAFWWIVNRQNKQEHAMNKVFNTLNTELNPICYLLALLGAHHFLHVSRIRVKSLTLRLLMSYIYGTPILDVSRSHTTTHHSR